MAKKFNDGQTFGEIRQILNDNADEINANKTEAEKLATLGNAGRVESSTDNAEGYGGDIYELTTHGSMIYIGGKGIPLGYKLLGFSFQSIGSYSNVCFGVPFYLEGTMYKNGGILPASGKFTAGWKDGAVKAIMMLLNSCVVAFDIDTGETWMRLLGRSNAWVKGSDSNYELPVASPDTLGGIKTGEGLTTETDGTTRIADNVNLPGTPTADGLVAPSGAESLPTDNRLMAWKTYMDTECRVKEITSTSDTSVVLLRQYRGASAFRINVRDVPIGYFEHYRGLFQATTTTKRVVVTENADTIAEASATGLTVGNWYFVNALVLNKTGSLAAYISVSPCL